MPNLLNFLVLFICGLAAASAAHARNEHIVNVSYPSILELPFNEADLTVNYGADKLQFAKMWRPRGQQGQSAPPLVIFVHGGCWLNAFSIDHSFALTSALADQGYLVWSLEYRRTGDVGGGWPGSFSDVQAGIDFILQHATVQFDPQRVFVVGHSAGGHLATLAAEQRNGAVTAIGLAAITDITKYGSGENSCQQAVSQFMGGTFAQKPSAYAQATATSFSHSILLHGTADTIVPPTQSISAKPKAQLVADAGHFDFLHPQSTGFNALISIINGQASPTEKQNNDR